MTKPFDAGEFLARLNRGDFDGRLNDAFAALAPEQIEQVARLAVKRAEERRAPGVPERKSSMAQCTAGDK
jgi:hypothetical protein